MIFELRNIQERESSIYTKNINIRRKVVRRYMKVRRPPKGPETNPIAAE